MIELERELHACRAELEAARERERRIRDLLADARKRGALIPPHKLEAALAGTGETP